MANPYDPAWEVYFEQRQGVKIADDLRGRRQLIRLWREQESLCPYANKKSPSSPDGTITISSGGSWVGWIRVIIASCFILIAISKSTAKGYS